LAAITRLLDLDLSDPHDAFTVRLALAYGRLGTNATSASSGTRPSQT
jgi:DNA-binding PucR family transcriptional regulator